MESGLTGNGELSTGFEKSFIKIMSDVLQQLAQILEQRKLSLPMSYVAICAGLAASRKSGKRQTVIAAKMVIKADYYETADLWFRCMVLLANRGPDDVQELQRRFGLSGLEEKAQRNK
jgi:phosphoribosyl-ATP pyrophosphohydrolase